MTRFAQRGTVNSPDAVAALALVRALAQELVKNGHLRPKDLEYAKAAALDEIPNANNEGLLEARRLVAEEFP